MSNRETNRRIGLLNIVLNYIGSRNWTNYDNFAEDFIDNMIENCISNKSEIEHSLPRSSRNFFRLNSISKESFLDASLIKKLQRESAKDVNDVLDFEKLFPEIRKISNDEAAILATKIDIPEDRIQDGLRAVLKSKGAFPISRRGKDSSLEIADIEHFRMRINRKIITFAVIVKGFRSIKDGKVAWKHVAHQVTRAYSATKPDYILFLTAKEPKDGLITSLTQFSTDVGNPNLIIFVPPLDLAKFMKAFNII